MSSFYVLNQAGETIVYRNYRVISLENPAELFSEYLKEEDYAKPPIFNRGGHAFVYIQHEGLYLLIVSDQNENAMMLVTFLQETVKVFESYFNKLTEESIRKNFVLALELMDEMMDYGIPQTTQAGILKDYICINKTFKLKAIKPPSTVTNAVSWRGGAVKHSKNEVFLDVIESLNLMVDQNGRVVRSEIEGRIKMKSFLSGMPELKLGLNDKFIQSGTRGGPVRGIELDDVKFHQCVRLSKFDSERTISFIPPDGEFEIMSYRLDTHVRPLFTVRAKTNYKKLSRVEYDVNVKSEFKRVSYANNVKVVVPVPKDADSPNFEVGIGKASYDPISNSFTWLIEQFSGSSEYRLKARFGLPKIESEDEPVNKETPYISVKFDIPYYTVSGLQVRYLKIFEKSGYAALPWVRYATRNGNYIIKITPIEE